MLIFQKLFGYLLYKVEFWLPPRKLTVINGDSLPDVMPIRSLVLARDNTEDWCIGLKCPCGCGRTIELLVIEEANPRWDYKVDENGLPTLYPSIWLKTGCKSHFWIKNGRINWA
jgi:hypothetical protein